MDARIQVSLYGSVVKLGAQCLLLALNGRADPTERCLLLGESGRIADAPCVATTLALLTLFSVGAGRTFFTGRYWLTSGMEMLLVGAAAAGAAYLVGALAASMIGGMV